MIDKLKALRLVYTLVVCVNAIKEAKTSISWNELASTEFAGIARLQQTGTPVLIEGTPVASETHLRDAITHLLIASSLKVKSNPTLQLFYSDHTLPWASKYNIRPQFNYIPVDSYLTSLNTSCLSFPNPRMNALPAVCASNTLHSLPNYCDRCTHSTENNEATHPHNNNTYLYGALYIDRSTIDSFSPGLHDMLTTTNKLQQTKLHLLVQSPGMQVTMHYDARELFILQLTGKFNDLVLYLMSLYNSTFILRQVQKP